MQQSNNCKIYSESCTDIEQEQKKQILALIFPDHPDNQQEVLEKLNKHLTEFYDHNLHYQLLINYAFRNHNSNFCRVYRLFLKEKHPDFTQPQMSLYYSNQIFPDLKLLGEYRNNPQAYPKRHIEPLQLSFYQELDKLFHQYGYIPHLERFLAFYPHFLVKQRIVERQLFENSKIDHQTAYFLAICAAAQIGCPYMINRMILKYLSIGGRIEWISNKKYPQKISQILNLNRKLARNIWDLTSDDFQQLIEQGYWNMNEIALNVQIMSYIHSLSIMTLGLGLVPEEHSNLFQTGKMQECLRAYRIQQIEPLDKNKKQPPLKQVLPTLKILIQEMKTQTPLFQPKVNPKRSFRKEQKSIDEEDNSPVQAYMKQIGNELTQQKLVLKVLGQLPLLPPYKVIQKRKDNKFNQFTCADYNFQFKAFPRLQSMVTVVESTKKISAWIKEAEEMGLQNFGSEMIGSTKELRRAQRYYAQNLCGFTHPEYDYKKYMTNILTMPLKFYTRILILSPLHMKRQILDQINHQKGEVQLFDLGHTAVLIAIAKFKLALTLTTYYFDN